jgi:ABC-type multidrug transport system, ATPase and permease components
MRTESSIVDALESLMQDRTTFLITHRLSALRVCDMHMKMEGGGITVIETLNVPFLQEPVLANFLFCLAVPTRITLAA